MTAEPDLLPMSSTLLNWPYPTNHVAIRDYARANVAHATAAKDAEIEVLRERAERLAEALREARDYVASELADERAKFFGYENCSNIASIEADLAKIDAALEQEAGRG